MKLPLIAATLFSSLLAITSATSQTSPVSSVTIWAMIQGNEQNPNSFKNLMQNIANADLKPTGIALKVGTVTAAGPLRRVNNCNQCWGPCMVKNGYNNSVYAWANADNDLITTDMLNYQHTSKGYANAFLSVQSCLTTQDGFKDSDKIYLNFENPQNNYSIPVSADPAMKYYASLSKMMNNKKIALAINPHSYSQIPAGSQSYFIPSIMLYVSGNVDTLQKALSNQPSIPFRISIGTSYDATVVPDILCKLEKMNIRTNPLFKGIDIYSINDVVGSTSTKAEVVTAYKQINHFINGDSVCTNIKATTPTKNAQQTATPNQSTAPQNTTTQQTTVPDPSQQ